MKYGLLEPQFNEVIKIISSHPEIEEAVLFGSRAINTFKEASDVDIALRGKKVSYKLAVDLQSYFEEETDLPYFFDFVSYSHITNKNLKKHIDRYGIVIYRKGWKTKQIREIGQVITGKTPSKNTPEDWGHKMPFITPTDYRKYKKKAFSANRNLSTIGINRLNKKIIPTGSSMVTCIGSDMGKVCMNGLPVITNQQINSVIPNSDIIDNNFLYYRLVSIYDKLKIHGKDGTAVPIVNKREFSNIEFTLPPLSEQEAIAEVLSSLDDKIELLHEQNKTLEDIAQTLFRKWFIQDAKPTWKEKSLSYFGKIVCGKTPSKKIHDYFGGEVPFIKIPDMHGNIFIFKTEDTLSKLGEESQIKKTLPEKSICVSCIATVGLVSMNAFKSQTNQQINSIIPNKTQHRYFIYLFMKSSKNLLESIASGGTTTLNLNTGNFSTIIVPTNNERIISKFHDAVEPLFEKIFYNQSQMIKLETLRDTLLPKLMNDTTKIKEVENKRKHKRLKICSLKRD